MYKTEKINVKTLVSRMRMMKPGEEIGLCVTEDGGYSYGIRCLPGGMFDNGMCWLADYYGGGATAAFSETKDDFKSYPIQLEEDVGEWLDRHDLLITRDPDDTQHRKTPCVYVQVPDGSLPETKWEFKVTKIQPKNRLVCVKFDLRRPYHTYVSVPPTATDDDVRRITKEALNKLEPEEFDGCVYADAEALDPFVADEDFVCMDVDPECNQQNASITDLPTGTLGR